MIRVADRGGIWQTYVHRLTIDAVYSTSDGGLVIALRKQPVLSGQNQSASRREIIREMSEVETHQPISRAALVMIMQLVKLGFSFGIQ